jgi:hypothetical protein
VVRTGEQGVESDIPYQVDDEGNLVGKADDDLVLDYDPSMILDGQCSPGTGEELRDV